LAIFNSTEPNGDWSLYVFDHSPGDGGSIALGWSLSITAVTTVNPLADLGVVVTGTPDPVLTLKPITYTIKASNKGPANGTFVVVTDTLPTGFVLSSATASQGTCVNNNGVVTCSLGTLPLGASATVTIVGSASTQGLLVNNVAIGSAESDLTTTDNSASVSLNVYEPIPAHLTGSYILENGVFEILMTGQRDETYQIQASTNLVDWPMVYTKTADSSGKIQFTDTAATNYVHRLYRAKWIP